MTVRNPFFGEMQRRKRTNLLPILLLFIVGSVPLPAKPPKTISFDNIGVKEGLSNPVVYDIEQGEKGFLWIATANGLNRYDGYEFRHYLPDKNEPLSRKTISNEVIIDLLVDREGTLWLGSPAGGLSSYDFETDLFTHYIHDPGDPFSISNNSVYALSEDSRGRIWIATDGGLNSYKKDEGVFVRYRHDPDDANSIASDEVHAVVAADEGIIWIGTKDAGLTRFDPEKNEFTHLKHDPLDPGSISPGDYPNLYIDSLGYLWITSIGGGLNRYDEVHDRFVHYRHDPNNKNSISYDSQIRINEDSQGDLWVSTYGGGVDCYDREKDIFVHYRHDPTDPNSLAHDSNVTVFEDSSGVLWFATYGGGISKYDRKSEHFTTEQHDPANPASLSNDDVHAIYMDSRGELWVGTAGGLNRYDSSTGTFRSYRHDSDDPGSIGSDSIWAISEDSSGDLWMATDRGVSRYSRAVEGFRRYQHDPNNLNSLSEDRTWSLIVDSGGDVWIGTQSSGLNRYDIRSNTFEQYDVGNFISIIYEDSRHDIWFAGGGLFRYDRDQRQISSYLHDPADPGSIVSQQIYSIYEDSLNNFWIGTAGGLELLDRKTGVFSHYSERDGLIDNNVTGILEEDPGLLWLSTARGISRFNIEFVTFRNYEIGTFNRAAYFRSVQGELFLGKPDGLLRFYPEKIIDNPHIPPLLLTSFKVFNEEVEFAKNLAAVDEISLSYKDKFFSFEFAALDFSDPSRNRYKYKLEGFDENWIDLGTSRRFASYTNLTGGSYTFRVIGSNNDGVWNEEGLSIDLWIQPPYWENWWFYTLIGLAVVMLLLFLGFYLIKLNSEISERKEAEKELQRWAHIFEHAKLGIVICGSDGKIMELMNPTFARDHGYELEELIGKPITDLIAADCIGEIAEHLLAANEKGHHSFESYHLKRDSSVFPVLVDITAVKEKQGDILYHAVNVQDLTNRRQMENQIRQSHKMEAIGTLAGGVAHDFNNILAAILGYAELLREKLPRESEEYEDSNEIYKAGTRAKELVNQILTFSRQTAQKLRPVQVDIIVGEALKLLRASLPATIEIRHNINGDALVRGDPTQIHQILMNLCTNAGQAMQEKGGVLGVSLDNLELGSGSTLPHFDLKPGPYLKLSVSDTGHGMPPELLERIFDPFFTTREKEYGTGMGLSVVHGIVSSYGGAINTYSSPGRGSTFDIYIPAIVSEIGVESEKKKEEPIPRGKEHILFVDDEQALVGVGSKLLTSIGYKVTVETSSTAALDHFKKEPDRFDLVITDMTMPNMTGDELAGELIAIRPDIPVILCTGFSRKVGEEEIRELGIKALLMKPATLGDMARTIRSVLDEELTGSGAVG